MSNTKIAATTVAASDRPNTAMVGRSGPVMPSRPGRSGWTPLEGSLRLTGGTLGRRQMTNATAGLEHGWRMLEAAGTVGNFVVAAGGSGAYAGDSYGDSDVYKWLEAVCWEGQHTCPAPVEAAFARTLDILERAQLPDGYLNSYVQFFAQSRHWEPTNRHEFYNLSHLIQAGIAAARNGGDLFGRLFEIALRAADQLERTCTGHANIWSVGHPGIEMALTELFRVTGDRRYLILAFRLLEMRGERKDVLVGSGLSEWEDVLLPMPWEPELTGHAVCAVYLAAGMTDLLAEQDDPRIERALGQKWDDLILRKSYLTGNIGSRHAGEALGNPYELPAARAYCETCAGVGVAMWCWRMLLLTGESRYADWFERVLYNAVFSGVSVDGRHFFYANPLEDDGDIERSLWYRCSCCPTNVMRLFAQLEHYVATQDASGIQIHQFAEAELATILSCSGPVRLKLASRFPDDGRLSIRVETPGTGAWALAIRLPEWCVGEPAISLNDERVAPSRDESAGYLVLRTEWSEGDQVEIELPINPVFVQANWRVRDLRSRLAVVRGPIVYCAEGHDQSAETDLAATKVTPGEGLVEEMATGPLGSHIAVIARGRRMDGAHEALYRPWGEGGVSAGDRRARAGAENEDAAEDGDAAAEDQVELRLIPYYLWANRGRSPMQVWLEASVATARESRGQAPAPGSVQAEGPAEPKVRREGVG